MEKTTFARLGLSPEILKAVDALGFEEPSPIQAAAIPILLTGRDIVGQSQTGSGKTAAFGIPAIEKTDATSRDVQVLIITPTRELATQVADEIHKLAAHKRGVHAVPIYGGASYERQFFELKKGVQIVIGTPGRLIDHLERGTLKLQSLKMAILDEADRMLDMGFREDIEKILQSAPKERQTVFFSATMSKTIRDLIERFSNNPETVRIEPKEVSAPAIEQSFYEVPARMKIDALNRIVDFHGIKLGIIFCNTQRMVDELADTLIARGYSADRLHGGIAQAQRTRVMNKFKKAEFEFLVATDVAARGIDVDELELVVNYDLPYDAEDYVHRIGRTGRAGKRGMAVTFVSGREIYKLQHIERFTRAKIRKGTLPTRGEVEERKSEELMDRVRATLDESGYQSHAGLVERFLDEGVNSTDLAAALFHLLTGGGPEMPKREAPTAQTEPPKRAPRPEPAPIERPERAERPERPTRSEAPPRRERPPEREPASAPLPAPERERERAPERARERPAAPRKKNALEKQWIALEIGKEDGAMPRELVDFLSSSTGIPAASIGTIDLTEHTSMIEIPAAFVDGICDTTLVWKGKKLRPKAVKRGFEPSGAGKPDVRKPFKGQKFRGKR